jgi:hypothetical protein
MNSKQSVAILSTSALAAGVAQGAVIQSGPLNLQQTFGVNDSRQAVNIAGDSTPDFTFGYEAGNNQKPYVDTRTFVSSQIAQSGIVNVLAQPDFGLPITPGGTLIDAAYASTYPPVPIPDPAGRGYMYFNDGGSTVVGDWPDNAIAEGFVGIQLALTEGTSYGWLHFISNPTADPRTLTLVDWAYESTPGVGIQTSVIPEPATGALAGLGLASLLIMRRRH